MRAGTVDLFCCPDARSRTQQSRADVVGVSRSNLRIPVLGHLVRRQRHQAQPGTKQGRRYLNLS